jgi:hypothetical protein
VLVQNRPRQLSVGGLQGGFGVGVIEFNVVHVHSSHADTE